MRIYSCANKKSDAMKHSEAKAFQLEILNKKDTRILIDKKNKRINARINRLTPKQKAQLVNVVYLTADMDVEPMVNEEFMTLKVTEKDPVTILGPPCEEKDSLCLFSQFFIFSSLPLIFKSNQKFKIISQGLIVPVGIFYLIN